MNRTDLVREWFKKASDDMRVANTAFDTLHPKPLEIIWYHCQQAAEKSLKGFLVNQDVEPPFIHDLEKLREICMEFDSRFAAFKETCRQLTDYAVTVRYPDHPEVTEADAIFALAEAEKMYTFCRALLPELQQEQTLEPE
jgi:HEPN domain-containing protein